MAVGAAKAMENTENQKLIQQNTYLCLVPKAVLKIHDLVFIHYLGLKLVYYNE